LKELIVNVEMKGVLRIGLGISICVGGIYFYRTSQKKKMIKMKEEEKQIKQIEEQKKQKIEKPVDYSPFEPDGKLKRRPHPFN